MPPLEVDDTVDAAEAGAAPKQARTPDGELVEPGTISTERVRRAVHRRVFGEVVEPVRIGRYAVLKRVGAGGMGVVYAAYDTDLDRKIALKLLAFDGADPGRAGTRRARLIREAQALARLSHPSIVQVFEVGTHEDQLFIAMEFIEGVTLGQWARAASRDWREIVRMYLGAGRGLAAAHAAGLVHRDFKPDNALVGDDGRVRVLDFGLAGDVGTRNPEASRDQVEDAPARAAMEVLTRTGAVLGTPAYMAPEQHMGNHADARSDQFGFCIALYEALYGQRPFVGDTLPALTASVLAGRISAPTGTRDIPRPLRRVLLQGLETDPARRWASMDALIAALEGTLSESPRSKVIAAAAGVSMMFAGVGGYMLLRTSDDDGSDAALQGEVAVERSRADAAEQQLEDKADGATLVAATAMLERDPTHAIAMLAAMRIDAPAWTDGRARMLAADAISRGVAEHVIPLPDASGTRRLSPGGRWAWSVEPSDGRYRLVELSSGRKVELEAGMAAPFPELTFSSEEAEVITAQSGAVRLWDLATGTSRELATLGGFAGARMFSSAKRRVVVVDRGERTEAIVIDLDGKTHRRAIGEHAAVISPDGAAIVAYDGKSRLEWLSLDGDERRVLPGEVMGGPTIAPDGSVAAALGRDGIVVASLRGTGQFVLKTPAGVRGDTLVFDPTSASLAMVSSAGPIVTWSLQERIMRRIGSMGARPSVIMLGAGGDRIAAMHEDGTVALHDKGGDVRVLRVAEGVGDLALLDGGARIVTIGPEPSARVWSWAPSRALSLDGGPVRDVALSDDGKQLFVGSGDGAIRRIDGSGTVVWVAASGATPPSIALSHDAVATMSNDRITRRDATGSAGASVDAGPGAAGLELVDDGKALAWHEQAGVALWREGTATPQRFPGNWRTSAMAPNATAFATIDAQTDVLTLRDVATGATQWTVKADAAWQVLRFDPSSATIAAAGSDDTIVLFSAVDGTRRDLEVPQDRYVDMAFTADGRTLFALGTRAHVVDVSSGAAYALSIPAGTGVWPVRTIDATPDGRVFAFAGADGVVWRHGFDAPAEATALRTWVNAATDLDLGADTAGAR